MRPKTSALAGTAGSLFAAGAVTAGFIGLNVVEDYRGPGGVWDQHGYANADLTTFRIYAEFDGRDDDGVLAVFGQPGSPLDIQSTTGEFHNDPLGGLTAPLDLTGAGIWQNQWDTYVTIGKTNATGDATQLSPGFATATNSLGTSWNDEDAGWFVTPDDPQSQGTSVLIAQLVVEAGGFFGSCNFNLMTRDGEIYKGLALPGPGAAALLAVAGLVRSRRRR